MIYRIVILLILLSGKCFCQEEYSDTVLVHISDVVFKNDAKNNQQYMFYCNAQFQPVSSLHSVEISFLDQNDDQISVYGLFNVVKHNKGFYFLESADHKKLTFHNGNIQLIFPAGITEYAGYVKLKITYTSISNIARSTVVTIPKS